MGKLTIDVLMDKDWLEKHHYAIVAAVEDYVEQFANVEAADHVEWDMEE